MLSKLDLLSVSDQILYDVLVFIYKIDTEQLPKYLSCLVKKNCDIHDYNTRGCTNFYRDLKNLKSTQKSIFDTGLKLYNMLPVDIRNKKNIVDFKNLLEKFDLCALKM